MENLLTLETKTAIKDAGVDLILDVEMHLFLQEF
jgi:hypothetical protein